jgi:hypothetical protein
MVTESGVECWSGGRGDGVMAVVEEREGEERKEGGGGEGRRKEGEEGRCWVG